MARGWPWIVSALIAAEPGLAAPAPAAPATVRVGSKNFTESVILGDMARMLAEVSGARAEHQRRLGDTAHVWGALLAGGLDAYVEYTGTLTREILAREDVRTPEQLDAALARRGLRRSRSLGFRDNYALGMRDDRAAELGVRTISDLAGHPGLRLGLSHPFIERGDGWAGLKAAYGLPFAKPAGMEHSLALRGLAAGRLDVVDLYTTDAEIARDHLRVLDDDRHYFPPYEAVLLYRADLAERAPEALASMLRLEGRIDEATMQRLNGRVAIDREPEAAVAAAFLRQNLGLGVTAEDDPLPRRLARATGRHALLVGLSLGLGIVVAVPLGVVAARRPVLGQSILALVGVLQTVPALALLSLLILVLDLGVAPAVAALFLYSLLPIVRNTYTGITDVPVTVRESAEALGLSSWDRLRLVELPMASRAILAGVKTAAVINVGFATLGGLIGAGGYGEAIMAGLNKADDRLILEGALPAVAMALAAQGLFEVVERLVVPRGLRL